MKRFISYDNAFQFKALSLHFVSFCFIKIVLKRYYLHNIIIGDYCMPHYNQVEKKQPKKSSIVCRQRYISCVERAFNNKCRYSPFLLLFLLFLLPYRVCHRFIVS